MVLTERFQKKMEAVKKGSKLFCAYLTYSFPNADFTQRLIADLEKIGVDLIEVGFPFSDPLADGPLIQRASEAALRNHPSVEGALEMGWRLRDQGLAIPLIFFSYFNPVYRYGLRSFTKRLGSSGYDGLLLPDCPPEEEESLPRWLRPQNLSLIHLLAPTSTRERIRFVDQRTTSFIYYVSLKGVTGMRRRLEEGLAKKLAMVKGIVSHPVLVGFGVSTPQHVRSLARIADGVIVGSAILQAIQDSRGNRSKVISRVKGLVGALHGG